MSNAEFEAKFRELQGQFLNRMESDKRQMRDLIGELSHADAHEALLKKLWYLVHRYTGNGRTFGFPSVSMAAGDFEKTLETVKCDKTFSAVLPQLPGLLEKLDMAFDSALRRARI